MASATEGARISDNTFNQAIEVAAVFGQHMLGPQAQVALSLAAGHLKLSLSSGVAHYIHLPAVPSIESYQSSAIGFKVPGSILPDPRSPAPHHWHNSCNNRRHETYTPHRRVA
jgi:hypothetical protein